MNGQGRSVQCQFTGRLCGIPSGRAEPRAVIGDVQVIVHGFGDADDLQVQSLRLGQLADLVAGVHGVIAAVVEKAADVKFFQGFDYRGIIRVGELPAAGTNGRSGGMGQLGNDGSGHVGQVDQISLENSFRPEPGGINLIYFAAGPSGFHHALKAGVDDSGRAAAVGYQNIHTHGASPQIPALR